METIVYFQLHFLVPYLNEMGVRITQIIFDISILLVFIFLG